MEKGIQSNVDAGIEEAKIEAAKAADKAEDLKEALISDSNIPLYNKLDNALFGFLPWNSPAGVGRDIFWLSCALEMKQKNKRNIRCIYRR